MKNQDLKHLYWRAGFGITPNQLNMLSKTDKRQVVDALFKESSEMTTLEVDTSDLSHFTKEYLKANKDKRKVFRDLSNDKLKELNAAWIERLVTTTEILREKMVLFWANHFVCRDQHIFYVQQYNNILRKHALGHFGDFVKAISKEPAMINYLNNNFNRRQKPNENFARELMELFTLGEGHYSETDVKESARAFTGYNFVWEGQFILRKFHHDYQNKTFFGETGRFYGDDIIDIILKQKQCARFVCGKIYRYFVNDTINDQHIEELTSIFYEDYNIENLMRYIFMSDWFYDNENKGVKIKSPMEVLVGLRRTVSVQFEGSKDLLKIQKLLGQILLNPPNVAGWKGGKNWIDSNTLMLRLKLPSILLANAKISTREKGEFEDSFKKYYAKNRKNKFVNTKVDWEFFDKQFGVLSIDDLTSQLLVPKLSAGTKSYLKTLSKTSKHEYCVQLMSLPEYQMC